MISGRPRAVLDTNVVLSAVLTPDGLCDKLLARVARREIVPVISPDVIAEYRRILSSSSLQARHGLSERRINSFLDSLSVIAIIVTPQEVPSVIERDPSDNIFLAAAISGPAQFVVSSDKHLLEIQEYRGIPIIRPVDFMKLLIG